MKVSWPSASYAITSDNITIDDALRGKHCATHDLRDVASAKITDTGGVAHVSLTDFLGGHDTRRQLSDVAAALCALAQNSGSPG